MTDSCNLEAACLEREEAWRGWEVLYKKHQEKETPLDALVRQMALLNTIDRKVLNEEYRLQDIENKKYEREHSLWMNKR